MRILLVDDEPAVLSALAAVLELEGHEVVTAIGGEVGMAAFLERSSPFSLVITDLGMPQPDGRTVATAIKRESPATAVVLLTGWGNHILTSGEALPDVNLVMSKPPSVTALRAALDRLKRAAK
jgi:DNA-binding NtrC family response regulator